MPKSCSYMTRLANDLIKKGYLRSDNVIDAFFKVRRTGFVPDDLVSYAEKDVSLPIGYGQTISQPLVVAFMLELLDVQKGQNVLDVGSGSGWTTALLAHIVGENGHITSLERIEQLCERGRKNVENLNFVKKGMIEFYAESAEGGYEKNAPYDRILVSAAAEEIPEKFKEQLAVGGKMVIPVLNSIWYVEKRAASVFNIEKFPGFEFVPFVKN